MKISPWFHKTQILMVLSFFLLNAMFIASTNAQSLRPLLIYKSPTCGCCINWVNHMEEAGFRTKVKHPDNLNETKKLLGVAPGYQACHTASTQGYVFEGHIPADVVKHFLNTKPEAIGLAVPGMPMGSPGMDSGMDFRPYEILLLKKDGSSEPYAKVSSTETIYYE